MCNITKFKLIFSAILTVILTLLGGSDQLLELLITVMIVDITTGILYAIAEKKLSSREMRLGLIRKFSIFLIVMIAVKIDSVILSFTNEPMQIMGYNLYIRSLFIIYFSLEEMLSVLENLANIGLPFPKWLTDILKQVTDTASNSSPKKLIKLIKNILKLKDDLFNDEDTEEETDTEEKTNTDENTNTEE
jgi:toxin secretion/phage lysis holin